jgi:LmbE family N-acetylglucosaminyl deacetylase
MCILAHPDDESLGVGGTLAKYADQGVEIHLITATRGERGRFGETYDSPGLEVVGKTREQELIAASKELGIRKLSFLDYIDGDLDKADATEVIAKITNHIRDAKPQVVLTFDPVGGYGHPDHIAISQFAMAAVVSSADGNCQTGPTGQLPHKVSKFYYMAWSEKKWDAFQAAFKKLSMTVDGYTRVANPWKEWSVTTRFDASEYWPRVWRAVSCHKTQMAIYKNLGDLSEDNHRAIWGTQEFYRVFSLVNGGRELETDLFAGLR